MDSLGVRGIQSNGGIGFYRYSIAVQWVGGWVL